MAAVDPSATPASFARPSFKTALCAKLKSSFDYLITKEYEREGVGRTRKQIESCRRLKFRAYVAMCIFGLGTMYWGGAQKVLDLMNTDKDSGNKEFTGNCVWFLTLFFLCSLVGMTTGTFHCTAPWALFFAGLGAWQSFLLILALFHLETRPYHLDKDHATYSFYICSFVFSLYWSYAAQDPLPLHSAGKLVVSTVCNFFYLMRWIWRSKGDFGSWFWRVVCCSASPRHRRASEAPAVHSTLVDDTRGSYVS